MQARSERFEMRLDPELQQDVDDWRAGQPGLPSRAEAMRRLIETGLSQTHERRIRLSDGEKLITHMLCELYEHLKIKGEIDPAFVQAALYGGHLWGLEWEYPGIFPSHDDDLATRNEVIDILDMWYFIESGYSKLSDAEKAKVAKEAEPFGTQVRFRGFDGNNEANCIAIARFVVDRLDRFAYLKDRDLNSHMPSLETYRRMFQVFEPMRRNIMGGELGVSQIIAILKAMIHPDYPAKA